MSIRFSLNGPALACAVSFCAVAPAWAQSLTPKDAWEALNAFVDGAGGRLSSTGLTRDGDAMIALNVTLGSGQGDGALELSFDRIRLEPRGERMAVIPSASFQAVSTIGQPGDRRVYAITHDGALLLSLTEAAMGLALDFGTLQITKTEARRQGRPLDEAFEMRLTGLSGQTDLTLVHPFDLQGRITAAGLGYDMRQRETDVLQLEQDGTSETRDLVLEFSATGLGVIGDGPGFMRRAFDDGFSARIRLDSGVTESTVRQVIGTQRHDFSLNIETSTATLGLIDGDFTAEAGSQAISAALTGDVPGTITATRFGFGFTMPIVTSDADRTFSLITSLQELRIGRDMLALLGAGDFADDAITLETEVSAQGRWLVEITDNPPDGVQPADFSSLSLDTLVTQLGAAMLTGSGSYTLDPGAIARMNNVVPEGEGRFQFELRGGEALLNRLGAIGLIPPDQQFLARMMMNGLGRSVGPDHLQSDVVIGRGGAVTVNGMPLPF
jgi:hypothetical protein